MSKLLAATNNKLIARLPDQHQVSLQTVLKPVKLPRDTVVAKAGEPIDYV